jgi:hypothetical protein
MVWYFTEEGRSYGRVKTYSHSSIPAKVDEKARYKRIRASDG